MMFDAPLDVGRAPVASVVIPAWNAAETLGEQLSALAAQVAPVPFEVVVCDNGSTDGTVDVVRSWAGARARWSVLRWVDASAVRGPGGARNAGARAARGALLLFCDADDVVGEGWVAALAEALGEHDAVAGQVELARLGSPKTGDAALPPSVFRLPFWPYLPASGAGYLGVRADAFAEVGGFDEHLRTGEDVDLCWRLQLAGYVLAQRVDAVVHVRERPGLRTAFRQELAYGRGDRQLQHKYARLVAATRGLPPRSGPDGTAAPTAAPLPTGPRTSLRWVRRAAAEVYRLRHPDRVATLARRAGRWLGTRTGAVDTSMPQVAVPPALRAAPLALDAVTLPVASIVIPAWNAADTLGEQLAALAAQESPVPFEVLVCDNGSTDGTEALVRSWSGPGPSGKGPGAAPRWTALRWVDASAVRGPSAARNAGARAARGGLLLFCDADDVAAEGWVAAMVEALASDDLVAGQVELARLGEHWLDSGATPPPHFRMGFWDALPAASSNNLGVRADAFAQVDGFDESLRTGEDVDLCWRLQLAGRSFAECRGAVMHVRARGTLQSVFRQAYAYGRGDRQLLHKYERVIAAGVHGVVDVRASPRPVRDVPVDAPVSAQQIARTLTRRRLPDPTYAVRRLGRWCGTRLGRVDRTRPQLGPDGTASDSRP